MFNVQKSLEKLNSIKNIDPNPLGAPTARALYEVIRQVILAGQSDEKLASQTINGSSLGWMLDQIRKQEQRIASLEANQVCHEQKIFKQEQRIARLEEAVLFLNQAQPPDDIMKESAEAWNKVDDKPSECEKWDGYCQKCGNGYKFGVQTNHFLCFCGNKIYADTISIPRSVAEEWLYCQNESQDCHLADHINQALKGE